MRYTIDPGNTRRSINFIDNICYSHVTDLEGKPLELYLSLMVQNGNSEARLAIGKSDEEFTEKQPLIVWINGAGWRECDKNLMAAEMEFFAEAGYAVACIQYRHSGLGSFPAQLIDCKTAVRFLRAHAEEYGIDPERVATFGRSAGGHLSAWMAMNTDGYDSDEWSGFSSRIQCAGDYFGPVDIPTCAKINLEMIRDPGFRWHKMSETHEGAFLGLTDDLSVEEILKKGYQASPNNFISETMCPIVIVHGDHDALVPLKISELFYDQIVAAGLEDRADFYVVKNGGHGTRELFQTATKQVVLDFFDKYLK